MDQILKIGKLFSTVINVYAELLPRHGTVTIKICYIEKDLGV